MGKHRAHDASAPAGAVSSLRCGPLPPPASARWTVSVRAQCRLLSISRSSFYHEPLGETEVNMALMQLIDRQFLDTPFYGVRQMTWHLQNEGHGVNQKRTRRLMRLMPIYWRPNTSKPRKGHKTYPYLLGGLQVDRPGQVYNPRRRHSKLGCISRMEFEARTMLACQLPTKPAAAHASDRWSAPAAPLHADTRRLFRFSVEHLLVPQLVVSTFPGQVQMSGPIIRSLATNG